VNCVLPTYKTKLYYKTVIIIIIIIIIFINNINAIMS